MEKKQWKNAVFSIITLVLLSLLVFWVFRGHYREIMEHIRAVRFSSLVFLLRLEASINSLRRQCVLFWSGDSFPRLHTGRLLR